MKLPSPAKTLALLVPILILNACTNVPVKEPGFTADGAYQRRAEALGDIEVWGLLGRISLDDGDQGGSGRLQWDVKPGSADLDFHGAMGRGAWRLQIRPDKAVLIEADGIEQTADSVNDLVRERAGWPIPVDALQWWVRGLAAPGDVEDLVLDEDGLPVNLLQFGWVVEFSRYDSLDGTSLPRRLNATRGDYRVKLAVSRWQMDVSRGAAD